MLTKLPKVGDVVRVLNSEGWRRLTMGKEYEVTAVDGDYYFYLRGDIGVEDVLVSFKYAKDFEFVTEPQPDVTDLIANLARRVSDIEKHLGFDRALTTRITDLETENAQQAYEINELYRTIADLEAKI